MANKQVDLERFSMEISRIKSILDSLENNRIYEITGARMDGSLSTNIGNLKKELNELFKKIQYGKESDLEKFSDFFSQDK